ncbi:MAG: amidohydrolase family protein [Hyphomicrobiales bacterium]|nr:amidohydrolase family protein [Hyphomicrobiales bacterium]
MQEAASPTTSFDVDRHLKPDGATGGPVRLTLRGGRIAAVTPIPAPSNGLLAMPAFANAHDHGRGLRTLAFGAVDDPLESWLPNLAREPRLPAFERAAVAFARMAETGIAATMHVHGFQARSRAEALEETAEVARAAAAVGIRVAFAPAFRDRNPFSYGNEAAFLAAADPALRAALVTPPPGPWRPDVDDYLAFVDEVAALEGPHFSVQYCPAGPQWARETSLAAIAEASARSGRRIHMHLLETPAQREWADFAHPEGLLATLDRIGFLSPRLSVAHGVHLRRDEIALLAERGVIVSVNTSSNLRLRSGLAPVAAFAAEGLGFGLGLDAQPMDDDDDMLREMRLVHLLHQGFGFDDAVPPARLTRAAFGDGRTAVLGCDAAPASLAPGAVADVAILDYAAMSGDLVDGSLDPLTVILTRATRRHLVTLLVGGEVVVAKGRLATLDHGALETRLLEAARIAWAAAPPDDGRRRHLRATARRFYGCGCHAGGFLAEE